MKKIVDNWLDSELAEFLEINFIYEKPHWFGHTSLGKNQNIENSFYNHTLDINEPINRYLFYKLTKTLKKRLQLIRMYFNVQWPNMNGVFHKDDGDITCLYMVTKSRKNNDGSFEIEGDKKIQFIQNRLICFDSNKMHRGLAPNKGIRITLAFKTKIV